METLKSTYRAGHDGDAWGCAIGALFDCAEYLYAHGEDIPDAWHFRPSPLRGEDYPPEFGGFGQCAGFENEPDGWTFNDVREFGNRLNRLANILRAHGKDY